MAATVSLIWHTLLTWLAEFVFLKPPWPLTGCICSESFFVIWSWSLGKNLIFKSSSSYTGIPIISIGRKSTVSSFHSAYNNRPSEYLSATKKNNADGVLKFQQCHLTSIGRALQCSLTKSTEEKTKKRNNYQIRLCAPKWKVFLSDCRWNEEQLLPSALHHFQGAWISCLASLLLPTTGSENMHRVFEVKTQFLCWILHCFLLLQIGRALALDFFPLLKEKNLCATTCNFVLN